MAEVPSTAVKTKHPSQLSSRSTFFRDALAQSVGRMKVGIAEGNMDGEAEAEGKSDVEGVEVGFALLGAIVGNTDTEGAGVGCSGGKIDAVGRDDDVANEDEELVGSSDWIVVGLWDAVGPGEKEG